MDYDSSPSCLFQMWHFLSFDVQKFFFGMASFVSMIPASVSKRLAAEWRFWADTESFHRNFVVWIVKECLCTWRCTKLHYSGHVAYGGTFKTNHFHFSYYPQLKHRCIIQTLREPNHSVWQINKTKTWYVLFVRFCKQLSNPYGHQPG